MNERVRHEVTTRRVVYEIPGQDAVRIRRGLPYAGAGGEALSFDLYEPPGSDPRGPRPAVIFVTGYNDVGLQQFVGCKAKEMASYVSWGQLAAMGGMVGVAYECREPAGDARALWPGCGLRGARSASTRRASPSGPAPETPRTADYARRLDRTRRSRCPKRVGRGLRRHREHMGRVSLRCARRAIMTPAAGTHPERRKSARRRCQ